MLNRPRCRVTVAIVASLVLVKLALVSGQFCIAIANASGDDALFVGLARSISEGDWLGEYDKYTLAKGPVYPLWIAALFRLHMPLFLGQHLLYAFACWLVVRALRPLRFPWAAEMGVFALVLFNPATWSSQLLRVVRSGIYPALTLLVVACAVGLYTHRNRSRASLATWSTGLGLALGAFWLTREEGLWLLPSLGVLFVATLFGVWRSAAIDRSSRMLLASCWILVAVLPVVAVCQLNSDRYGVFSVTVFGRSEFRSACGALMRVTPAERVRYVSVSAETRQRVYRVSRSFSQLRPYFEGEAGRVWSKMDSGLAPEGEIAAGWFAWAFHHAASKAGYTLNARQVMAYYLRVANEVNDACEMGTLECGPPRSSALPRWYDGDGGLLLETVARSLSFLAHFDGFSVADRPAVGQEVMIRDFEAMTRERAATPAAWRERDERAAWAPAFAAAARRVIGAAYQNLFKWWLVAALGLWAWVGLGALKRRSLDFVFVLNTALLGACVSRAVVLSLISISAVDAINLPYFSPAYPLMLLFCTLATADAFRSNVQRQATS